ncbi:hypothetical protein MHW47_09015 [Streptomyces sp. OfavH-34-F]|uniref:hypothetical protein n=1 Tax=Streptomyces sp. OfavH-34-F TaxID=2917760 RepID=UPI001EF24D24|nr:hypothetical protein [Streptomyces sp. OfavH-34-F]MCG7524575.1 hypothetical protein [Streptomyces sp. OfavH-34-F]
MFAPGELDGQENERTTNEITGAAGDLWSEAVRVALTVAEVVAVEVSRYRQQKWERERREEARAVWEDRQRAEPVLRAAWDEEFWQEPEPHDIGRAWQAATEWAPSDPAAAATLQHLRRQLEERYGLSPADIQVNVPDLAKALALGSPGLREEAATAREEAARWGETTTLYVIRDPDDPEQILHRGELRTAPGEDIEAAAARELRQWCADQGHRLSGTVIETAANDGSPAGGEATARVTGERAEAVIDAETRRQRRLVSGAETGSPDEVHHAIIAEMIRTEEAGRLLEEGSSERAGLREKWKGLNVQAQAVTAEMRGEDPSHVYQGAELRARLSTESWWDTAPASEVAGVWGQIDGWPPSPAKEKAFGVLKDQLFARHGLDLESGTSAETVAELLGGPESATPAATYSERAATARQEARRHYGRAFDAATDAARLKREADELAGRPDADLSGAEARRNEALVLDGRAALHQSLGAAADRGAERWSERADGQAGELGVRPVPEGLREAYARRWGTAPAALSDERLDALAAGASRAEEAESSSSPPRAASRAGRATPSAAPATVNSEAAEAVSVAGRTSLLPPAAARRRTLVRAGQIPYAPPVPDRGRGAAGAGID